MKYSLLRKLLTSVLTAITAAVVLFAVSAQADAVSYSGKCGANATWSLDTETGVLKIGGSGAMTDYIVDSSFNTKAPWATFCTGASGYIKTVIIDNGITNIGEFAFCGIVNLTDITIPASVMKIGCFAFRGCSRLTRVTVPDNVTLISDYAFFGCSGLTCVNIPNGVTKIGDYAFYGCSGLTGITIPNGVIKIGSSAFYGCSGLTVITIPNGVTNIGGSAFSGCSGLTDITIPFVGNDATAATASFSTFFGYIFGCTSYPGGTAIRQYNGMNSYYFYIPSSLKSVTVTGGRILYGAFYNCGMLTDIKLGEGVLSIGSDAFCNTAYYNNKENWSNGILYIGQYLIEARASADGLYQIKADTVYIADSSFSVCSNLTSITVPESVAGIGSNAFANCSLYIVQFYGNAPVASDNIFPKDTVVFYCPDATGFTSPAWNGYACYSTAAPSEVCVLGSDNRNVQGILFTLDDNTLEATVGDNTTAYNNSGYLGMNGGKIVLPETVSENGKEYRVTSIGQRAFSGNNRIISIHLPDSLLSVGENAFDACLFIEAFSVSSINLRFFADANGVLYNESKTQLLYYPAGSRTRDYTVPESVISIRERAFNGARFIERLCLPFVGGTKNAQTPSRITLFGCIFGTSSYPKGIRTVQYSNSSAYETYYIPSSLKTITVTGGNILFGAFSNCSVLTSVILKDGVELIDGWSFKNCSGITDITIPASVKSIGENAFYSCSGLKRVSVGDGVTSIGNSAFYECSEVEYILIGKRITSLGSFSFPIYKKLNSITVSDENTVFSTDSCGVLFNKDKTSLLLYPAGRTQTYYTVPGTVTSISAGAFANNSFLMNVLIPKTVIQIGSGNFSGCIKNNLMVYIGSAGLSFATANNLPFVTVESMTLTGITLVSEPTKKTFLQGTRFDFSGLIIVANYSNGDLQLYDYSLKYDNEKAGNQTVTVSYGGCSVTFGIFVKAAEITGIEIKTKPNKLIYPEGVALDTTGLSAEANYNNGKAVDITGSCVLSGYNANTIGKQTVTVSYSQGGNTYKDTFTAEVLKKKVSRIAVTKKPTKLEYKIGETLDLNGIIVTVYYDNNTSEPTTAYIISGFNGSVIGLQKITVSFSGKTDSFTVNTIKNSVSSPAKPSVASKTDKSVTLAAKTGYEYRMNNGTWQKGNVFTGLNPNTGYSFSQRIAETEISYASAASTILKVTTNKSAVSSPAVPSVLSKTDKSVTLAAKTGCEYRMNNGTWQKGNVFTGLNPNTGYSFSQRIAETEISYASAASPVLKVTTNKAAVSCPAAPSVLSKTDKSVTLAAKTGYEYRINNGTWQTSNVFTGLNPNTEYSFFQRIAETEISYASAESPVLKVSTIHGVTDITVKSSGSAALGADGYVRTVEGMSISQILAQTTPGVVVLNSDNTAVKAGDVLASGMKIVLKDSAGRIVSEKMIVVLGDVDGNGKITSADARLALRAAVKLDSMNSWQAAASDIDGKVTKAAALPEAITAADARLILRAAVRLDKATDWLKNK